VLSAPIMFVTAEMAMIVVSRENAAQFTNVLQTAEEVGRSGSSAKPCQTPPAQTARLA
jgi:hypothetical protein